MQLYYLNIDKLTGENIFEDNYSKMNDYRKQKIDRIKFEDKKRQCLGAGMLLEYVCNKQHIDNEVSVDKYNKPYLVNSNVKFNISHSGNYVIIAVSNYDIGVDTEDRNRKKELTMNEQRVIKSCFTKYEQEYIYAASSEKEKVYRFFRIWTIKEAYVKREGRGILRQLYTFEINLENDEPVILNDIECKIYETGIGESNIVTVCCNRSDNCADAIELDITDFEW